MKPNPWIARTAGLIASSGIVALLSAAPTDLDIAVRADAGRRVHADTEWVPGLVHLPSLQASPVIDGDLSDAVWQRGFVASGFSLLGTSRAASQQTTVSLFRHGSSLFAGITCFESEMAGVVASVQHHDGPVWEDDCVEVFIDLDHDHRTYAQFVVNAAGVAMEAALTGEGRLDLTWGMDWQWAVRSQDDRWTVEMAVPLDQLSESAGPVIGLNVAREERPHAELSSWMPQQDHFAFTMDEMRRFADVVVADASIALSKLTTRPVLLGQNQVTVALRNLQANAAVHTRLVLTLIDPAPGMPRQYSEAVSIPPGGEKRLVPVLSVPDLHEGIWWVEARALSRDQAEEDGGLLLGRFPLVVSAASVLSPPALLSVGHDAPLEVRVAPVIAPETLVGSQAHISVASGEHIWRGAAPLSPLAASNGGTLVIPGTPLPLGELSITAAVRDAQGDLLGVQLRRRITRLRGPFARRSSDNSVPNGSFEAVDGHGLPAQWQSVWWAPSSAGMQAVPVADFIHVQKGDAFQGERCLRIQSTHEGDVPAREVLHVRSERRTIEPGYSYRIAAACRTKGLQGRAKIWMQLPGRQLVLDERLSGDNPQWTDIAASFTPAAGEDWCQICLSLDGKAGTVWYDEVTLNRSPPRIESLLVPNAFQPLGHCQVANRQAVFGLRLQLEVYSRQQRLPLKLWHLPLDASVVSVRLPADLPREAADLVVRLLGPGGRLIDARSSGLFAADTPFPTE